MKFKEGNSIIYFQDFRFFFGVPHGVDFNASVGGTTLKLSAPGYGKTSDYGNGALLIRLSDSFFFKNKEIKLSENEREGLNKITRDFDTRNKWSKQDYSDFYYRDINLLLSIIEKLGIK